ncbi:MAG: hypothetical protein DRP76_01650, partial [Candidatus Omnitrophota bacterium]
DNNLDVISETFINKATGKVEWREWHMDIEELGIKEGYVDLFIYDYKTGKLVGYRLKRGSLTGDFKIVKGEDGKERLVPLREGGVYEVDGKLVYDPEAIGVTSDGRPVYSEEVKIRSKKVYLKERFGGTGMGIFAPQDHPSLNKSESYPEKTIKRYYIINPDGSKEYLGSHSEFIGSDGLKRRIISASELGGGEGLICYSPEELKLGAELGLTLASFLIPQVLPFKVAGWMQWGYRTLRSAPRTLALLGLANSMETGVIEYINYGEVSPGSLISSFNSAYSSKWSYILHFGTAGVGKLFVKLLPGAVKWAENLVKVATLSKMTQQSVKAVGRFRLWGAQAISAVAKLGEFPEQISVTMLKQGINFGKVGPLFYTIGYGIDKWLFRESPEWNWKASILSPLTYASMGIKWGVLLEIFTIPLSGGKYWSRLGKAWDASQRGLFSGIYAGLRTLISGEFSKGLLDEWVLEGGLKGFAGKAITTLDSLALVSTYLGVGRAIGREFGRTEFGQYIRKNWLGGMGLEEFAEKFAFGFLFLKPAPAGRLNDEINARIAKGLEKRFDLEEIAFDSENYKGKTLKDIGIKDYYPDFKIDESFIHTVQNRVLADLSDISPQYKQRALEMLVERGAITGEGMKEILEAKPGEVKPIEVVLSLKDGLKELIFPSRRFIKVEGKVSWQMQLKTLEIAKERARIEGGFRFDKEGLERAEKGKSIHLDIGGKQIKLEGVLKNIYLGHIRDVLGRRDYAECKITELENKNDKFSSIQKEYWELEKKYWGDYLQGVSGSKLLETRLYIDKIGRELIDNYKYSEEDPNVVRTIKDIRKEFAIYDDLAEGKERFLAEGEESFDDIYYTLTYLTNKGVEDKALENLRREVERKIGEKDEVLSVKLDNGKEVHLRVKNWSDILGITTRFDLEGWKTFQELIREKSSSELKEAVGQLREYKDRNGKINILGKDIMSKSDKDYYLPIFEDALKWRLIFESLGGEIVENSEYGWQIKLAIEIVYENGKPVMRIKDGRKVPEETRPMIEAMIKVFNEDIRWEDITWDNLRRVIGEDVISGDIPSLSSRILRVGFEFIINKEKARGDFNEKEFKRVFDSCTENQLRLWLALLADKSGNLESGGAKTLPAFLALITRALWKAEVRETGNTYDVIYKAKEIFITRPQEVNAKIKDYGELFKKFGLELVLFGEKERLEYTYNQNRSEEIAKFFSGDPSKIIIVGQDAWGHLWHDALPIRRAVRNLDFYVYDEFDMLFDSRTTWISAEKTHYLTEVISKQEREKAVGMFNKYVGDAGEGKPIEIVTAGEKGLSAEEARQEVIKGKDSEPMIYLDPTTRDYAMNKGAANILEPLKTEGLTAQWIDAILKAWMCKPGKDYAITAEGEMRPLRRGDIAINEVYNNKYFVAALAFRHNEMREMGREGYENKAEYERLQFSPSSFQATLSEILRTKPKSSVVGFSGTLKDAEIMRRFHLGEGLEVISDTKFENVNIVIVDANKRWDVIKGIMEKSDRDVVILVKDPEVGREILKKLSNERDGLSSELRIEIKEINEKTLNESIFDIVNSVGGDGKNERVIVISNEKGARGLDYKYGNFDLVIADAHNWNESSLLQGINRLREGKRSQAGEKAGERYVLVDPNEFKSLSSNVENAIENRYKAEDIELKGVKLYKFDVRRNELKEPENSEEILEAARELLGNARKLEDIERSKAVLHNIYEAGITVGIDEPLKEAVGFLERLSEKDPKYKDVFEKINKLYQKAIEPREIRDIDEMLISETSQEPIKQIKNIIRLLSYKIERTMVEAKEILEKVKIDLGNKEKILDRFIRRFEEQEGSARRARELVDRYEDLEKIEINLRGANNLEDVVLATKAEGLEEYILPEDIRNSLRRDTQPGKAVINAVVEANGGKEISSDKQIEIIRKIDDLFSENRVRGSPKIRETLDYVIKMLPEGSSLRGALLSIQGQLKDNI